MIGIEKTTTYRHEDIDIIGPRQRTMHKRHHPKLVQSTRSIHRIESHQAYRLERHYTSPIKQTSGPIFHIC